MEERNQCRRNDDLGQHEDLMKDRKGRKKSVYGRFGRKHGAVGVEVPATSSKPIKRFLGRGINAEQDIGQF